MKSILILSLTLAAVVLYGCASREVAVSDSNESRQIVDMTMDENPDSLILSIRGNQKLSHTENKQNHPQKIELFFPATSLDGIKGRFVPPDNDIISSIIANEHIEDKTINSTIDIALKSGSNYTVNADKDDVQITFFKSPTLPGKKTKPPANPARNGTQPPLAVPAATALKTVSAEIYDNSVAVKIEANGTIERYNAFTLANPDRFVFDLFNVRSPHSKEQKVAVRSKWIKRIRYFGHPQKLRLEIETSNHADSKYSAVPSETGLIIHVGAN